MVMVLLPLFPTALQFKLPQPEESRALSISYLSSRKVYLAKSLLVTVNQHISTFVHQYLTLLLDIDSSMLDEALPSTCNL